MLMVLATTIHGLGITLLVTGVVWLVTDQVAEGVLALLVAVAACPWLKKSHHDVERLPIPVDQAAMLRWTSELAGRVGVPPPQRVYVSPSHLASTSRSPRGKRELHLGLQLFALFDREETEAVLLHEFGHWAGNDPSRGVWVYTAQYAIERPLYALRVLGDDERTDPGVRYETALYGFPPLLVLTTPLRLLRALFLTLRAEDRMECEYAADHAAAQVSGADPLVRFFRVFAQFDDVHAAVQRQIDQRSRQVDWAAVRASLRTVPDTEIDRRMWADQQVELHRYDHPPAIDRVALIQRWASGAPLTPTATSVDIDAVVRPAVEAWSRMLANTW